QALSSHDGATNAVRAVIAASVEGWRFGSGGAGGSDRSVRLTVFPIGYCGPGSREDAPAARNGFEQSAAPAWQLRHNRFSGRREAWRGHRPAYGPVRWSVLWPGVGPIRREPAPATPPRVFRWSEAGFPISHPLAGR